MISFLAKSLPATPYQRTDLLMGTVVHQAIHGNKGPRASARAAREIGRLETLWSRFKKSSETERLHRRAGVRPSPISLETARLLRLAQTFHSLTGGVLDISAGPLIERWDHALSAGSEPDERSIRRALALLGIQELIIERNHAFLPRKGQRLDLGGIGKGAAADRAAALYRAAGVASAYINLGGNVRVIGNKPDGSPWRVGIRHPEGGVGKYIGFIQVSDCSVVTSGSYERFTELNGVRYHHILDPTAGRPASTDAASVTVIAASSMVADALSTAAFIRGVDKGAALIESFRNVGAIFVNIQGIITLAGNIDKNAFTRM